MSRWKRRADYKRRKSNPKKRKLKRKARLGGDRAG